MKTQPVSQYERFLDSLHDENLRGYHEMQAMRHGIAARLGLNERDALELAVKIVAVTPCAQPSGAKLSRGKNEMYSDKQQRQTV